ncbi:hypothetical protein [Kitasatospora sp. NPDC058190]|uniref:hypothetical protein n=1 Tax=Kitasatospora sp. NPDC058190 TaxID=3346371 RepID=UPI0036DEE8B2
MPVRLHVLVVAGPQGDAGEQPPGPADEFAVGGRRQDAPGEFLGPLERYAWFTLSADRGGTGLYNRATPDRVGTAYRAAG